eukprot:TRINITY_DN10687_c0_g1_i1.p1 TRINITY_DN10687_c0_g1~~TRINITY_DN10687_c0_g1_i1.p1  ORF type:complete len:690 (+),score=86.05 TRINITY_DN10687_c0_g1_i1:118-2070(+)
MVSVSAAATSRPPRSSRLVSAVLRRPRRPPLPYRRRRRRCSGRKSRSCDRRCRHRRRRRLGLSALSFPVVSLAQGRSPPRGEAHACFAQLPVLVRRATRQTSPRRQPSPPRCLSQRRPCRLRQLPLAGMLAAGCVAFISAAAAAEVVASAGGLSLNGAVVASSALSAVTASADSSWRSAPLMRRAPMKEHSALATLASPEPTRTQPPFARDTSNSGGTGSVRPEHGALVESPCPPPPPPPTPEPAALKRPEHGALLESPCPPPPPPPTPEPAALKRPEHGALVESPCPPPPPPPTPEPAALKRPEHGALVESPCPPPPPPPTPEPAALKRHGRASVLVANAVVAPAGAVGSGVELQKALRRPVPVWRSARRNAHQIRAVAAAAERAAVNSAVGPAAMIALGDLQAPAPAPAAAALPVAAAPAVVVVTAAPAAIVVTVAPVAGVLATTAAPAGAAAPEPPAQGSMLKTLFSFLLVSCVVVVAALMGLQCLSTRSSVNGYTSGSGSGTTAPRRSRNSQEEDLSDRSDPSNVSSQPVGAAPETGSRAKSYASRRTAGRTPSKEPEAAPAATSYSERRKQSRRTSSAGAEPTSPGPVRGPSSRLAVPGDATVPSGASDSDRTNVEPPAPAPAGQSYSERRRNRQARDPSSESRA